MDITSLQLFLFVKFCGFDTQYIYALVLSVLCVLQYTVRLTAPAGFTTVPFLKVR